MNDLRLAIEDTIERLIAVLDQIDGDTDAEPEEPKSDGCDEDYDVVMWA